jgi:hypothetical protein
MPSTNHYREHAISKGAARITSNQVQEVIIIPPGQDTNKMSSGPTSSSSVHSAPCVVCRSQTSTKPVELEYTPQSIAAHSTSTARLLLRHARPLMLSARAATQTPTTSTRQQMRGLPPSRSRDTRSSDGTELGRCGRANSSGVSR